MGGQEVHTTLMHSGFGAMSQYVGYCDYKF